MPTREQVAKVSLVDEGLTEMFYETMTYTQELAIEVIRASPQEVCARMPWKPSHCTIGGAMHGGVIMGLADATAAACAFANLPPNSSGTTTIESKTNFLRPVRSGYATATSRPLHTGSTFIVIETDVYDEGGRLVARTLQTQAVLRPRDGRQPSELSSGRSVES